MRLFFFQPEPSPIWPLILDAWLLDDRSVCVRHDSLIHSEGTFGEPEKPADHGERNCRDLEDGAHKDLEVESGVEVPDVVEIVEELAADARDLGIGWKLDLRQPSHARTNVET